VWKVLPIGLKSACAIFQSALHQVFDLETRNFLALFLDYVLCFSKSFDDNFEHLKFLFDTLRKAN